MTVGPAVGADVSKDDSDGSYAPDIRRNRTRALAVFALRSRQPPLALTSPLQRPAHQGDPPIGFEAACLDVTVGLHPGAMQRTVERCVVQILLAEG